MFSELVIGDFYKRSDLDDIFSTTRFSSSREGIVSFDNNIILFCTLEKELKDKQFHYNDFFEADFFRWDSQNPQHINTPTIQKMVKGTVDILLFCRVIEKIKSKSQPFVYCGRLEFSEHFENTARPVHIIFESIDYQENPNDQLKQIYAWRPGGTRAKTNRSSIANKVSKRRSRGQGYESDPKVRKAIELHAMERAIKIYEKNGYKVVDTSANHSYDLHCSKEGKKDRKVEVKGTTGLGESIILTANEVVSARDNETVTDLIIIHSIKVNKDEDEISTEGGVVRAFQNWRPSEDSLVPTQFRYTVDTKS